MRELNLLRRLLIFSSLCPQRRHRVEETMPGKARHST